MERRTSLGNVGPYRLVSEQQSEEISLLLTWGFPGGGAGSQLFGCQVMEGKNGGMGRKLPPCKATYQHLCQ